ncbi:MAG: UDP-4-amino-4,6-dideoxy-N-acetyl-beta-L-altrosamine transaminase [Vampirovibrio sp.]|nr:UDP-4-amino-4,6-dideoxy-N-acetyl-beta-L-altrosamine transaminase [Vampirovibrio sp.]
MSYIPYGRQHITPEDIQAVVDVLQSDYITQGPTIQAFEQTVAQYCGARYAVAMSNATAALHIACLVADMGPGDRLWTSPNTFVASANCGLYCGATVDFVDIDPKTYNMSVSALEEKLIQAQKSGTLPKIIVPVHFSGQSCEMQAISTLAKQYGITVLEDAAHAIGGDYQGHKIGGCQYSDMTVFSFHPVKIITTGEGGMVLTNRKDLYEKLCRLRSHGVTRDKALLQNAQEGAWYYEQQELGFNYRMTDIQAALGVSQMKRLDEFVDRRRVLASQYDALLKDLPLKTPWQHPDTASSFHLYVIQLDKAIRRQVFDAMRAQEVGVHVHYIPVHTQPYYQDLGFKPGDFPYSEQYYQQALSLPLYYDLTDAQQQQVVHTLTKALQAAEIKV